MITIDQRARLSEGSSLPTIYAGVATALGAVHPASIEELTPDAANADSDLPRREPQRKLIATKFV
jgi:hypothetical protein